MDNNERRPGCRGWMAGVVVFWLRLLGGWMMAERLRRRQVRLAPAQWQQALDRLRTRLRILRPVPLLVSGLVHAPAVVGLWRPVVLVVLQPASMTPEPTNRFCLRNLG